jgi:N-acetylneuraminic acid mutarotase
MACDDTNGKIVLFGGVSYGDTWTFDPGANKWRSMGASGPAGLHDAAMAFDNIDGLMVLFGGWSFSSQYGYRYHNDTWVYSAKTDQWTQRTPANAPSPRIGHTLSFDPANGVMLLFGGEAYDQGQGIYQAVNDTWIYSISANIWASGSPVNPPPARLHHAAAFDCASREVVLFGGWGGRWWNGSGYQNRPWLGDTWTYNVSSDRWTNRTPSVSPQARSEHAMTFDATNGCAVIFGGCRGDDPRRILDDTWTYDPGTNAWTNRTPPGSPFPQYGHAMAYCSASGVSVLFSGYDESGNVSETWSYNAGLNRWTNLIPPSGPSPRTDHAMAWDNATGKVVLFGGEFFWGRVNDTWVYDAVSNAWTCMSPTPRAPSARQGHAMVYDSRDGVMVLFGGTTAPGELDDTWTYNLSTNTWVNMAPPSAPPPRTEHAMVYDSARCEVMLFGGTNVQYSPYRVDILGDTWTYNVSANRWTQKTVQPAPSARTNHAMAYDPTRGVAVLFGGSGKGGLLGDTWTYCSSTGVWINLTPQSSPRPGYDYAMAYGGPSSDVLLFGGWDGSVSAGGGSASCHAYPNETWSYRAATNTWTNRSRPAAPAPRFSAGMAYDIASNAVVMFGGYSFNKALDDTWMYGSLAYFTDGVYTSLPHDTGGSAYFGALEWNASVPAGTAILFQTRGADTRGNLSGRAFRGPDGNAGTYHAASGQRMSGVDNGSRWVQYRAYLKTTNLSETPRLQTVTVNYNLLHNVSILAPAGGENWNGTHCINWIASDPDNDSPTLDIILIGGDGSVCLASGLTELAGSWEWNTSAVPNGTYRIRLVARDDNAAIPLTAGVTSPEFTVFHPGPPNHAPTVTYLAPANNSIVRESRVQFCWRGEDEDRDTLIYNLTYWVGVPGRRDPTSVVTRGTTFNATLPDDNVTYLWNVTAFDGKDRTAPSPEWRFDVNTTVPNRPPVITSAAPANATAGVQYQYLMTAEDPDGDTLTWKLPSRPQGMVLGAVLPGNTGIRILWTPAKSQQGNWSATVEVADGRGGWAEQTFSINVDIVRPGCNITQPADGAEVKGTLRVFGTAARGSADIVRVEVRIDGGGWMVANGALLWVLDLDTAKLGNGNHTIDARATDGELHSEPATVRIIVTNNVPRPKPIGVALEGFPWWIPVAALAVAGLTAFILLKPRKKDRVT